MRNIIQQGFTSKTKVGDDSKPLPIGFLTSNSRDEAKFVPLSVYGVVSNPPRNSHILILNAQGQASNKFGIVNDFLNRKKDLVEGEVALFNSITGDFVFLKETGIEVVTAGDLTATVAGKTTLDSTGDVDLTAPNFNFAGNVNIEGDVDIVGNQTNDGTLAVTGDISSEADVIADSGGSPITMLKHFHLGNLGYNTGIGLPAGGGVVPPSSPPSAASGDLNMNGNDITNVSGIGATVGTHIHKQGSDSNGDAEVDTDAPS